MEDLLLEKIIKELSYIYNVKALDKLFNIFFLRCMIYHKTYKLDSEKIVEFMIMELNIPNQSIFLFNNIEVSKRSYQRENSLENICDNLMFLYLDKIDITINGEKKLRSEILKDIYLKYISETNKVFKYDKKKDSTYVYRYTNYLLSLMNNEYNLKIESPRRIEYLTYPANHNDFAPSFDIVSQRYTSLYIFNNKKIKEKELENYIMKYGLNGITLIDRQVKLESGILDILGRDNKTNEYALIELKVSKRPKDIIYQIKSYSNSLIKKYKVDKIRKIAIGPGFTKEIIKELIDIDCEIYNYTVESDKITIRNEKNILL